MQFASSAKWLRSVATSFILLFTCLLTSCGFHLQGEMKLTPPLHTLYLRTSDPYGYLSRTLKDYMAMSHVTLVDSPDKATTILDILADTTSQNFVTVGGSQQTRQYNLIVNVIFQVTDSQGRILMPPENLSETRSLFLQSNQILGASNEATVFYQQMRRALAYSIMNRLASKEVTAMIDNGLMPPAAVKNGSED